MVLYKEIHLNNPKQDNKSILRTIYNYKYIN